MKRVKVGNAFNTPLKNGYRAFGRYVDSDVRCSIAQVYKLMVKKNKEFTVEQILESRELFPPVHASIHFAVCHKIWAVIGNFLSPEFIYRPFVCTFVNTITGKAAKWYL